MFNKCEQLVHHSTSQQANNHSSYHKLHLTQPTYLSESVCPSVQSVLPLSCLATFYTQYHRLCCSGFSSCSVLIRRQHQPTA